MRPVGIDVSCPANSKLVRSRVSRAIEKDPNGAGGRDGKREKGAATSALVKSDTRDAPEPASNGWR